jgi:phosphatidylinositol alpha-1,6-mannosyltransferase
MASDNVRNSAAKSLLISGSYFPPQVGGISHYMAAIASALGPDLVCCLTGVPAKAGLSDGSGIRVYRRPTVFAETSYLQKLTWCEAITRIMVRERPHVVQVATADEAYLGLWLRRWLRLPFVIYAHGNEILDAMQSSWIKPRLALQQANRVLSNSRFTMDLLQQLGVKPNQIELVHPGCDVDHFRPLDPIRDFRKRILGSRYKDHVILTVGGLVPRKGQDMVIKALPLLHQTIPDLTYLIVGYGPLRAELEALALQEGVRDRVVFTGKVPDEDLPQIYALCDIFVMPSREQLTTCDVEGFGLVFLEANACGKPVIGGRSGGIAEAVVDGVTGLLVNPHDLHDIAHAIRELLTNRDRATLLGQRGRSRVVTEFNWKKVGDRVQNIIDSVLREQSIHG